MGATSSLLLEKAEIESVLQAGVFAKAPRLETFFRYICERYLRGEADLIKEYSIATEALGRSGDFDPKRDSIVRVEAHRLRRRLEEFYRGAGASHSTRIVIPNGQYRPEFVPAEIPSLDAEPKAESFPSDVLDAVTATSQNPPSHKWLWAAGLAVVCAAITVLAIFSAPRTNAAASNRPGNEVWKGSIADFGNLAELRILAGYHGAPVVDRQGHKWVADAFYKGGASMPLPVNRVLTNVADTHFIRSQRSGQFEYNLHLRPATYELHLYMVETEYGPGNPRGGGESARIFRVSINGAAQQKTLDPLAEASGPNRLYERVFKDVSPGPDGILHLAFDPLTGPAFINALALMPSPRGRIHPIRIVAQENPLTDSEGHLWAADEYFSGGNTVCRQKVLTNSEDALFHGERYGNFSYRIPVAPGKYRLTLHFAETWFGTPQSNAPALNSRIFNVFVNGVTLLRDYQVIKDAGAPYREVKKVFEDLEPNAQGNLLIEFVPVENYAEINAIEVVETG
jgi:Malectin domain